jgi:hypothetical protein
MTLASALLVLLGGLIVGPLFADLQPGKSGTAKPSAARLKGMKEALADIEKGQLRQKEFPLPDPAWFGDYLKLLKDKCGVDWVTVEIRVNDPKDPRAEIDGYNDVMRVEIEHRFGKDILEKLRKQAETEFLKGNQRK